MDYKVVITPDAEENIDDAITYYKVKASLKVARTFLQDFNTTYKDIQKNKYYQLFFDDFRGKPMKKFPYIVFYTIDEKLKIIFIKAVFHTSQNPNKYPTV